MEKRIVILITPYLAAARRAFFNVVALMLLVAGVNAITTSASGQDVNDRYYRFEEESREIALVARGVLWIRTSAHRMERQTAVRSTAPTCHWQ